MHPHPHPQLYLNHSKTLPPTHPTPKTNNNTTHHQQLQYVVDFDARFHILVGEAGGPSAGGAGGPSFLSSQALMELLDKRLEYFNLTDTVGGVCVCRPLSPVMAVVWLEYLNLTDTVGAHAVPYIYVMYMYVYTHLYIHPPTPPYPTHPLPQVSLFLLRFPPETLFELEDIAMDAAMDSFDDDFASGGGGGGSDAGGGDEGPRPVVDEEGNESLGGGVDLRLMGQLIPRFLGKVCPCLCVCQTPSHHHHHPNQYPNLQKHHPPPPIPSWPRAASPSSPSRSVPRPTTPPCSTTPSCAPPPSPWASSCKVRFLYFHRQILKKSTTARDLIYDTVI